MVVVMWWWGEQSLEWAVEAGSRERLWIEAAVNGLNYPHNLWRWKGHFFIVMISTEIWSHQRKIYDHLVRENVNLGRGCKPTNCRSFWAPMADKLKSNKLGRLLRLAPDFDLCHIGFKKYTKKNLNSRFVKYWWLLGALGRIQWIDSSPWNGCIGYIKRKKTPWPACAPDFRRGFEGIGKQPRAFLLRSPESPFPWLRSFFTSLLTYF